MIIMGHEQKPGEPNSTVSFRPVTNLSHFLKNGQIESRKDKIFLIISSQGEDGEYYPVLKTECQPRAIDEMYHFNRVRTNSRILANDNKEQYVVFSVFKFRDQGKAKKLGSWSVKF